MHRLLVGVYASPASDECFSMLSVHALPLHQTRMHRVRYWAARAHIHTQLDMNAAALLARRCSMLAPDSYSACAIGNIYLSKITVYHMDAYRIYYTENIARYTRSYI